MIIQLMSVAGACLILLAFALLQLGRWRADQVIYLWANLVGAGLLSVVAWLEQQWGFLLLESVWTLVSGHSLLMRTRRAT